MSYAETILIETDLAAFGLAAEAVERLRKRLPKDEWLDVRCHEIARFVHRILAREGVGGTVFDGLYVLVDHSWILTPDMAILDPYAVGRLPMVQILDARSVALYAHRQLYTIGPNRSDIRWDLIETWEKLCEKP